MTDEQLIADWLARNEVSKLPTAPSKPRKRQLRRGKWRAARSFKPGGRLS